MNRFYFKGFEPNEVLKSKANIAMNRMLDIAPYGSTAVALLEKDENGYHCLLDVYSRHGPFTASASYSTQLETIALIEKKMTEQLCRWSKLRFGEQHPAPKNDPKILTDRKMELSFKTGSHSKTEKEDHSYEYEKSTYGFALV